MPEQSDRRVPRGVLPAQQPAVVGHEGKQQPCRLTHGRGKVHDGGIHTDYQVQLTHDGGGVGEVAHFAVTGKDQLVCRQVGGLPGARKWRRMLSEEAYKPAANENVVREALKQVIA